MNPYMNIFHHINAYNAVYFHITTKVRKEYTYSMSKIISFIFLFFAIYINPPVEALSPILSLKQESVIQGEPIMATIDNVQNISEINNVKFDTKKINLFLHNSKPTIFIGTDLKEKVGEHTLIVTLNNNKVLKKIITIEKRPKIEAPLGIPEKLGGNTTASQKKLTTSLEKENLLLENLPTNKRKLWSKRFIYPLDNPIVVDSYGYSRQTGQYSIAHKGTDFRAKEKTPIYAMNRGVVRIARNSPIYGNMVVIDHGIGLMTFYMHLSTLQIKSGQIIEQGKIIGLSGQTGYALGPHLHLTVRLNSVSVDPMKFMAFFEE